MTNPICPLCQRQLRSHPEYPDTFECPTQITYADVYRDCLPISHYECWNNQQHTWYVGPYRIEQDETGLTINKFNPRSYRTDYKAKPSWEYLMYLEQQIKIDDSNKTLNKIKTILVFS